MDFYSQLAQSIIKKQESIIGPIAFEQAKRVPGIIFDEANKNISIEGDKKVAIESLIRQYEKLFGPASIEVCRGAVKNLITTAPIDNIPQILL